MMIGFVGLGRIGIKHVNAAIKNNLNIHSIFDLYIDKSPYLEKYPSAIGNALFDNEKLKEIDILDIVSILTPSNIHVSASIDLIEKYNKNLIIEKPLGLSLKDIDRLIEISSNTRAKITVCHQNRFNLAVKRVNETITKGYFGKIHYIAASIRWNRSESYYSQSEWRGRWKSDGGALMNQSIHNIDLLLWLMNSPVVEVFGYIDNKNHPSIEVEDMGVALLKFANGSFGIIDSSMNIYPENFEETLSIFGQKGTVVLGGKSVNKIVHWNVEDDPISDLEKFNEEVDGVYGNGHIALYKDFIEAIEHDREPAVTLQDGRNAVEVILAIYLSSFEKRPVSLPLPPETSTIMFEGKSFK